MGAQWKQAGREEHAKKKGIMVGKLAKEIAVAAKLGDPNPDNNPRLRLAVEAAKKHSVTRDTIERAIKKGAGLLDEQVTYELVTYEGFAPHKVPVIVECLTENKNRTAAEVRVLFRKGQLGGPGSVAWMFDRLGVIEASSKDAGVDIEGVAIEAGAQNVEPIIGVELKGLDPEHKTGARFFTDVQDLDAVTKAVTAQGWKISSSEMSYVAKNYAELDDAQKKEVGDFLNDIDDFDDVHRVYVALKA